MLALGHIVVLCFKPHLLGVRNPSNTLATTLSLPSILEHVRVSRRHIEVHSTVMSILANLTFRVFFMINDMLGWMLSNKCPYLSVNQPLNFCLTLPSFVQLQRPTLSFFNKMQTI